MTSTPVGAPMPPPHPWRLVRARNDKVAGVCAGLAAAAGLDVTLVRIAFVLAGLSGFGVIAYLVLVFVVPKEDPARGDALGPAPANVGQWIRIALIVGGVVGLFGLFDNGPRIMRYGSDDGFGFGFGMLLIVIGAVILWARRGRPGLVASGSRVPSAPMPPPAPMPPGGPAPTSGSSWPQPSVTMPTPVAPSADPWATDATTTTVTPATVTPQMSMPAAVPPMPYEPTPRASGGAVVARVFGWLTVLGALPVALAIGGVVRIRALSLPGPYFFLLLGLAAIVNLIVWSSIARRAVPVLVSIFAVFVVGGIIAGAAHWNGEIGETTVRPATRTDLLDRYEMAIGHQVLDLSDLSVTGDPVSLEVDLRIGLSEIVVPDDATVSVTSDVAAGVIELFGVERDGASIDFDTTDGTNERTRFQIDASVGWGRLEVCRAADAQLVDGTLRCVEQ